MRTISELLTILRDNTKVVNNKIWSGLCHEVSELAEKNIFSYDEKDMLYDYIDKNRPRRKSYYGLISFYGWPQGEWPPRLAWLNEHIELNKQKEQ